MKFSRSGIILCTAHYLDCVAFYRDTLGLPVLFALDNEASKLTCCDMGGGVYLMIETGGTAAAGKKTLEQNPVCLRFNVDDVDASAAQLEAKNVAVSIRREAWGTVADFTDPDGNRCSLREEGTFGH